MLIQSGTIVALILLILFFFAMRPDMFLSFVNIRNILYQISILAIIAGAQTIVMVVGDFDLSRRRDLEPGRRRHLGHAPG